MNPLINNFHFILFLVLRICECSQSFNGITIITRYTQCFLLLIFHCRIMSKSLKIPYNYIQLDSYNGFEHHMFMVDSSSSMLPWMHSEYKFNLLMTEAELSKHSCLDLQFSTSFQFSNTFNANIDLCNPLLQTNCLQSAR